MLAYGFKSYGLILLGRLEELEESFNKGLKSHKKSTLLLLGIISCKKNWGSLMNKCHHNYVIQCMAPSKISWSHVLNLTTPEIGFAGGNN